MLQTATREQHRRLACVPPKLLPHAQSCHQRMSGRRVAACQSSVRRVAQHVPASFAMTQRPQVCLACAAIVLLLAPQGSVDRQQPSPSRGIIPPAAVWRAWTAQAKGDDRTAALLLKSYLFEIDATEPYAQYTLGLMYRDGRGVPRDKPRACALLMISPSEFNWLWKRPMPHPYAQRAQRVYDETCASLTKDETDEMGAIVGVGGVREGPDPTSFTLGRGHWVQVDGSRMLIEDHGRQAVHSDWLGFARIVLPLVYTPVQPLDAAPGDPRNFIEVFFWAPCGVGRTERSHVAELFWLILEVRGLELQTRHLLVVAESHSYPGMKMPDGLRERARLELNEAGDVEWVFGDQKGVIEREGGW